jgi:hypothetical protein
MNETAQKDPVSVVIVWQGKDYYYCYAVKPNGGPAKGWQQECKTPHEYFDDAHDFARKTWPEATISS